MPIKNNLIGKQFDQLKIIEETQERDSNGTIIWKAQCSCGEIIKISTKQLNRNKTNACSNCKNPSEIGKKYGKLLVIEEIIDKQKVGRQWKCKCDCENIVILSTNALHQGTSSCGCLQKETASLACKNLIGQRFGRWKVLEKSNERTKARQVKWICQCSCEKHTIRTVAGVELLRGSSLSCGCLRASHGEFKINQLLQQHQITYETEKIFDTCILPSGYNARFDFFVNNSYIIEFDGIQHFQETNFFANNLSDTLNSDLYKNNWCKENNITIIRIPYTKLDTLTIEDLLLETSNFIVH